MMNSIPLIGEEGNVIVTFELGFATMNFDDAIVKAVFVVITVGGLMTCPDTDCPEVELVIIKLAFVPTSGIVYVLEPDGVGEVIVVMFGDAPKSI